MTKARLIENAIITDPHRKISDIRYNVLNLPDKITFNAGHKALYSYDATGVKRRMEHITVENTTVVTFPPSEPITYPGDYALQSSSLSSSSSTANTASTSSTTNTTNTASTTYGLLPTTVVDQTVTDYCGSVIYENGSLKYILTPEGYVSKNGNTVIYNYYLKDHLGNNRIATAVNGSNYAVIQKTDYYPFGKPYADGEFPERQPYKFGGKEYDEMFGMNQYDFEARQLDAMIPRFTTMDPLAEKYYSISPYAYCANNPVNRIDPDGEDDFFVQMGSDSTLVVTVVVTGENTPNRLFINDPNADENTENRYEFEGQYYEMNMIPSQYYSDEDYESEGLFGTPQFDRDRYEYIYHGGDYTDKNWFQRSWESMTNDLVTWGDVAPVLLRGGKAGKATNALRGGKGKGERGHTKSASGTANPDKHVKPDPNRPGKVLERDPHTGKWISKDPRPGYVFPKK
jgi:RHS repeat-associated protein